MLRIIEEQEDNKFAKRISKAGGGGEFVLKGFGR
jgi:hypothetical protein